MQKTKGISFVATGLIIALALLANVNTVEAHWKVVTRNRCRWWRRRFKAVAYTRCWWMWPSWNCIRSARHCDNAVTGTCTVTCFNGQASCRSWNGWGGWGADCWAWGDARFGSTGAVDSTKETESLSKASGDVRFTEDTVYIVIEDIVMEANAKDGSVSFVDAVVWQADGEFDDKVTREKIVAKGSIRLQNGEVKTSGFFSREDYKLETETTREGTSTSVVTISGLNKPISVRGTDTANLVVEISGDGNFRIRDQCLADLDAQVYDLQLDEEIKNDLRTTLQAADEHMDGSNADDAAAELLTFQQDVSKLRLSDKAASALIAAADSCSKSFLSAMAINIMNIQDGDEVKAEDKIGEAIIPLDNGVSEGPIDEEALAELPLLPFITGTITGIDTQGEDINLALTINSVPAEFKFGIAPLASSAGYGFIISPLALVEEENLIEVTVTISGSPDEVASAVVQVQN